MSGRTFSGAALQACLIGAAVFGAVDLMSGPGAKAACLNAGCTDFDPTTSTSVSYSDFIGGILDSDIDKLEVIFSSTGQFNTPFTITGLSIIADGTGSANPIQIEDGTLSYSGSPTTSNAIDVIQDASLKNFANATVFFTLPSGITGINSGSSFTVSLRYFSTTNGDADTSDNNFTTVAQNNVPGPLPVLGAGAAFGFSRKLRRRTSGLN